MSCGKPSRAVFKASAATCQSSAPCRPCPVGNTYSLPNENLCCDVSEWIDYTPTITDFGATVNGVRPPNSTLKGRYKIDGNIMHLKIVYKQFDNVGGVAGNGVYSISLPNSTFGIVNMSDSDIQLAGVCRVEDFATLPATILTGTTQIVSPSNFLQVNFSDGTTTPQTLWGGINSNFNFSVLDAYEIQITASFEI